MPVRTGVGAGASLLGRPAQPANAFQLTGFAGFAGSSAGGIAGSSAGGGAAGGGAAGGGVPPLDPPAIRPASFVARLVSSVSML